jgi:hypothetical protein
MSYAEARNGKLALYNDIAWSALSGSASFEHTRQGVLASQTLAGAVQADYQQAVVEVGAAYELWSNGVVGRAGTTAFDILAGARYWHQALSLSADLSANITGNFGNLQISGTRVIDRAGSVDWIDPVIGGRVRHQVAPGESITLRADIGGFGIASDRTWQAIGTYEWQIMQFASWTLDAYIGYRALYVDYTKGTGATKYEYDVLQHGPVIGATVRF